MTENGTSDLVLSAHGVTKKYGNHTVLDDVSLEVKAGEVVALLGRSGSGKSTFLRCAAGLEKINQGSLVVCGHALGGQINRKEFRRHVGIVFQAYNLFPHLTVGENIQIALRVVQKKPREQTEEICRNVLDMVGLLNKKDSYPARLSGGQQQRVAIARSLALSPSLMLFDEVTSALDPELTGEVLRVMEDLANGGMAMLLVTHELKFASKIADRTAFMLNGKVCEFCDTEGFFSSPKAPELQKFLQAELG
jgi:polar amino acid transport system ATP-binding protein